MVAAPTGDRFHASVVSFTDTEVIVGSPPKQGRIRNMANTIVNNNKLLTAGPSRRRSKPAPYLRSLRRTASAYEVDFGEGAQDLPRRGDGPHLRYLHSIADTHCKDVDESNCVLTVPLDYTGEQRDMVH